MPLLIDDLVLTFFRRRCLCRSRLGNLIHVALTWEKMGVPGLNEKPALSSQNGKVHCCNGLRTTSVLEETSRLCSMRSNKRSVELRAGKP